MFDMIGILVMSILGGGALIWLNCPTPIICLPYYLKCLTSLVLFIGGWLSYEMAGFAFGDNLFPMSLYVASSFAGSMWFVPFFSTYGVSFIPLGVGYRATEVFDSG
jgi:NADH-ubiquinone oxidoreductase chain 5